MGKGVEQTLPQGGHTESPETHEKMLTIISYQREQIKTTMRCYFTPVRMAIVNKSTLIGMQTGEATVENSMGFTQKTKNGTAFCPSDSTAGIIP